MGISLSIEKIPPQVLPGTPATVLPPIVVKIELSARSSEIGRGQRRRAIVESLLAEVFTGQLRGGQHLVTQDLAERFGVSHTPIREALIALSGIGVIDLLPNRGAIVREVTAKDVREVCQVRRVLECEATRLACGRVDLEVLEWMAAELRKLLARATYIAATTGRAEDAKSATAGRGYVDEAKSQFIEEARALDSRLHDLIATSCGNDFLAAELSRLKQLFRAYRDVSWAYDQARNDYRRLAGECREHLAIVEALLAGDAKAAARAMSQHIRSGVKYWTRSIPATGNSNGQPKSK
jgi:DNA-binding GntR family transcriptional regulator